MFEISYKSRLPRELSLEAPYVSPQEAGEILGISRRTFMRRAARGEYDHIARVCMRGGWRFDIYAVMKTAYPWAPNDTLVDQIKYYREKFYHRRCRKRRL